MAQCSVCGKHMAATTKRKRYCSRACQQASYRHRKANPTQTPCDDTPRPLDASLGLTRYVYPERVFHTEGPTPGALQGDDYSIVLDDNGYPELPACLDRRKPKLDRRAA